MWRMEQSMTLHDEVYRTKCHISDAYRMASEAGRPGTETAKPGRENRSSRISQHSAWSRTPWMETTRVGGNGHGPRISQARHLREQSNDSMFRTARALSFDALSLRSEARPT